MSISFIFLLVALASFGGAAARVDANWRVDLTALGLALLTLAFLIGGATLH